MLFAVLVEAVCVFVVVAVFIGILFGAGVLAATAVFAFIEIVEEAISAFLGSSFST